MSPREKPDRASHVAPSGRPERKSDAHDRETEMLRALVRELAREAAREAFERALADQQAGRLEDAE